MAIVSESWSDNSTLVIDAPNIGFMEALRRETHAVKFKLGLHPDDPAALRAWLDSVGVTQDRALDE